jgi:hypothetical protein
MEDPASAAKLEAALSHFQQQPSQSAVRMRMIQQLIRDELTARLGLLGGLLFVGLEQPLAGKHRLKDWDVLVRYANRPQLAISTKSIISNVAGSVPNRIDDAMGECVNVHAHDPGMVLGYFFIMDSQGAAAIQRDSGRPWGDVFANALLSFSGRRSSTDSSELFEGAALLIVDFGSTPLTSRFHPALLNWNTFFDLLINHVRTRNPVINRLLP